MDYGIINHKYQIKMLVKKEMLGLRVKYDMSLYADQNQKIEIIKKLNHKIVHFIWLTTLPNINILDEINVIQLVTLNIIFLQFIA